MSRVLGGMICTLLLGGCGAAREEAIETAVTEARRQLASDIQLTIHRSSMKAYYQGDERVRYSVCGFAELHRPSTMPEMNIDHSKERFVTLLYYSGAVITTFSGQPEKPGFSSIWNQRCR